MILWVTDRSPTATQAIHTVLAKHDGIAIRGIAVVREHCGLVQITCDTQ